MKHVGRYDKIEDEYDIDHEINEGVKLIQQIIKSYKETHSKKDTRLIFKALATELIDSI